jgi:hypothetical protein
VYNLLFTWKRKKALGEGFLNKKGKYSSPSAWEGALGEDFFFEKNKFLPKK